MAKYFLTNKAVEDLANIWDYTYHSWSENQADKYYELLIHGCAEIASRPDIGKVYEEISNKILGFCIGKHIIFYRLVKPEVVEILRILHGSMNLKNKINE